MLLFYPFERSQRPLSSMKISDQKAFCHTGLWLCLFCYKRLLRLHAQAHRILTAGEETEALFVARDTKWSWIRKEMIQIGACQKCGLAITPDNVYCFEWDHVDEKLASIFELVNKLADDAVISEELKRCRILCVECHRRCSRDQTRKKRPRPKKVDSSGQVIKPIPKKRKRQRIDVDGLWL